jgi:hypothetical protein
MGRGPGCVTVRDDPQQLEVDLEWKPSATPANSVASRRLPFKIAIVLVINRQGRYLA